MQQISPFKATVQQPAVFFEIVLSCKLIPSTFNAAGQLGAQHFLCRGLEAWYRSNPVLFIALLRHRVSGVPETVPLRKLVLVLQVFLVEPFEPLEFCAMKFITQKIIFLVTLASVWHVSCLHALSLEPDPKQPVLPGSLRFGLHNNQAFVAKDQRLDSNPLVVINALCSFIAGQREPDNLLCPFHALLYHFKHYQPRRGICFCLFLQYKFGQRDNKLQPDSISMRIKSAIGQAYTSAGNSPYICGLARISALDARGFSTQLQLRDSREVQRFSRLPTGTMRPPLQVFTCVLCQVSLRGFIALVPFQWPNPQLATDFWGFRNLCILFASEFFPRVVFSAEFFCVCVLDLLEFWIFVQVVSFSWSTSVSSSRQMCIFGQGSHFCSSHNGVSGIIFILWVRSSLTQAWQLRSCVSWVLASQVLRQ